jgi:histidine ammonia-lyase
VFVTSAIDRASRTIRGVSVATRSGVVVGDAPLSLADVGRVAGGGWVDLGDDAIARITASRAVVDGLVNGETLIYGLNTGLGHMRNERVPLEVLQAYQQGIVLGHAGGIGPALPTRIVRAAMFVRIVGIARGGAGCSLAVARQLVALLNAGVHPIVPEVGSIGAADLMHMAAIASVVIGHGQAEFEGEVLTGDAALRRAGLAPVQLQPKDGLALVSANGVSIGHAALLAAEAAQVADLVDVVLAVSLEAIGGNASIVDPVVLRAKPVPGQIASGDRIRRLLAGSDRCVLGAAASVQDALSFRVGPQVHGGLREAIDQLQHHVELELNASDDNPFVDVSGGRMVSNGNFHPFALALAADALRPALAHVGQLSDRRMDHLFTQMTTDPKLFTSITEGTSQPAILLRYSAAAQAAQLRGLAAPATLDVAPLDLGIEDHATNATFAVDQSARALRLLTEIVAIELLMARDAIRMNPSPGRLGAGTAAAIATLDAAPELGTDLPPAVHEAVRLALPRIAAAAEAAAGVSGPGAGGTAAHPSA